KVSSSHHVALWFVSTPSCPKSENCVTTGFLPPRSSSSLSYRRTALTPSPSPELHLPLARGCFPSAALRQRGRQQRRINEIYFFWALQFKDLSLLDLIEGKYFQAFLKASQPIYLWGRLVFITHVLKIINGFTEIFTEANVHTMFHLSCLKSCHFFHLPVDSSGLLFPSSFSPEERTVISPPISWRHLSISITVLLSCGAVRSGPEDAAEVVPTNFRGADWMLTSQLKVTIFLLSDHVVKATPTHSSTVLNSLSSSFEDLSFPYDVVVVYVFIQRGWLIPSIICSQVV
ncbi:hypothetical protein N665_0268s0020, partial [Sinapis alba]